MRNSGKGILALLIILALVAAVGAVYVLTIQSSLAADAAAVDKAWADVAALYQSRAALIGNVSAMAKSSPVKDRSAIDSVDAALALYRAASSTDQAALAATDLDAAYAQLLVALQDYPSAQSLEAQIEDAGTAIAPLRDTYDAAVREYNARAGSFIATVLGARPKMYYQPPEGAVSAP